MIGGVYGYIAAAVLAVAVIGFTYYRGHSAGAGGVRAEWAEANRIQRESEAAKASSAAQALEVDRVRTRTVYRTITEQVERIVEKPVYRDVCLDPELLQHANAALVGALTPAAEPPHRMPPADAAPGRD